MAQLTPLALGALVLLGAACSSPPAAPAPTPDTAHEPAPPESAALLPEAPAPAPAKDDYLALREEIGALVASNCGTCHTASSAEAKPKALAVFDLDHEDWPSTIQPEQHPGFRLRLASKADDGQKQRIEAFLAILLARSGGGNGGPAAP